MNPKTCYFIQHEKAFLGVPPRSYMRPSRVFGFIRIQDANLVKKSLKSAPFMIQQVSTNHYTVSTPHGAKGQPIPRNKMCLHQLEDVITSVFFTRVNNVDLVLIDEVQVQSNKVHMYSNFNMDMDLDVSVRKHHFSCLVEDQPINYKEKLEELMTQDTIDDYDDDDDDAASVW